MNKGITLTIKLGPDQLFTLCTQSGSEWREEEAQCFQSPNLLEKTHSSVHPGGLYKGILRGQRAKGEVFPFNY